MVALAALCAAVSPAWADDAPRKTYRRALAKIKREQDEYWKRYPNRWSEALEARKDKTADGIFYSAARARALELAFYNHIARLYADYAEIETRRGEAAVTYAQVPGEHTHADLLKDLHACVTEIQKAEDDLYDALKRRDERTPIRRHALERRRTKLLDAWRLQHKAVPFLADKGLRSAEKKDRRRRIDHRAAVLEALGRCGDEEARKALEPWLEHQDYRLRIVALEALFDAQDVPRALLAKRLGDPNPVVRRALLAAIRERDPKPEWEQSLKAHIEKSRYLERNELADTLRAIGSKGPGVAAPLVLFSMRSRSNAVLILVEGTYVLRLPADPAVECKHSAWWWTENRLKWVRDHDDHQKVLARKLRKSFKDLDSDFYFNVAMLHEPHRLDDETLGNGDLVRATQANRYDAVRILEKFTKHGWAGDLVGLFYAMDVQARRLKKKRSKTPVLDTVYLISDGKLSGLYSNAEAAVEAFLRRNRFHRIVVNTVRISDGSRAREAWLEGLAKASGGEYSRAR